MCSPSLPGVGGADNPFGGVDKPLHDAKLLARILVYPQLPGVRDHGELPESPLARPGGAVVVGIGVAHQVPEGPGDDAFAVRAFHVAVAFPAGADHAGNVTGDTGFLGNDNRAHLLLLPSSSLAAARTRRAYQRPRSGRRE